MKKKIKKIIGFALIMYGCSSGQYFADKEITFDDLKKLQGTPAVLKVTTRDTIFSNISSWEIRDSSLAFLDYGKNYVIKVSQYQHQSMRELNGQKDQKMLRDYNYPKPDTLVIPFKSIIKIEHSGNANQTVSEDKFKFLGGGFELDARKNELTLGFLFEFQYGLYRPIIEHNTTFNNSTDKLRISSAALYSFGYMLVGFLIGSAITGDSVEPGGKKKGDNNLIWTIVYLPLFLTNAEHHIYLIDPFNSNSDKSVGLSLFTGFRLDIYDSEWIVYSPGVGIQIGHYWSKNEFGGHNNSIDFQIGVEYPYEDRLDKFQDPKISAGFKFKFL